MERASDCKVLSLAFSAILDMLGSHRARESDKASNFAAAFDLLGVTFFQNSVPDGISRTTNKVSRIEEFCSLLDHMAEDVELVSSRAIEIQGLVNSAVGLYSGKSLKHLVAACMPFAVSGEKRPVVTFTDRVWGSNCAIAGAVIIDRRFRVGVAAELPVFVPSRSPTPQEQ